MVKIQGCDISWWQGVVDFVKMKLKAAFCIIRAGSVNAQTAVMYSDYNLDWNASQAEEAEMPKGFYWYYREFGKQHAIEQARHFWNLVKSYTIEEGLFIDVEVWNATRESVIAFLVELQKVSGLPDNKIGVYSRASLWNPVIEPTLWFKRFKCWVARYFGGDHPWGDSDKYRMKPWDEYDYWQHSADGNGRGHEFGVDSEDIDLNWKLVHDTPPVDPPAAKSDVILYYNPLTTNIILVEEGDE